MIGALAAKVHAAVIGLHVLAIDDGEALGTKAPCLCKSSDVTGHDPAAG